MGNVGVGLRGRRLLLLLLLLVLVVLPGFGMAARRLLLERLVASDACGGLDDELVHFERVRAFGCCGRYAEVIAAW